MPGSHHVCERQQGRHQGVVGTNRQNKERSVRLRDTQGLGLCSAGLAAGPEEAAMDARGLQSIIAKHACAVGVRKRHHDHVTAPDCTPIGADGFDDADRLVAHTAARWRGLQFVVGPKIASTDAGAGYADNRVSRMHNRGIGHVLDPDITSAVHDSCTHAIFFPF